MNLIQWEDYLPRHPKIDGFSTEKQDPRDIVTLKGQFFAAVNKYNANYELVVETYNVDLEGARAFDKFYNTTTVSGVRPFVKRDERGVFHIYRFNKPPTFDSIGGRFNVTVELLKTELLS